jgi:hypothetical protein
VRHSEVRVPELAELTAWCQDDRAGRLRLVTGPGGVGKTRLAVELADRIRAAGWRAERVADGAEAEAIGALRAVTRGRALLVVDYAETRAGLGQMLSMLAGELGRDVRVLLLTCRTRTWSPWLSGRSRGNSACPARLSRSAAAPAAAGAGSSCGALVAVLGQVSTTPVQVDVGDVLSELLRHEQHFWYDSARVRARRWAGRDDTPVAAADRRRRMPAGDRQPGGGSGAAWLGPGAVPVG